MKTAQKMTFLRKEVVEGVSKKTGQPYRIENLYFLDDELQEVKMGVARGVEIDLEALKALKQYEVNINIQLGNFTSVNVLSCKAI